MAKLTYKVVSASSVERLTEFVDSNLLLGYKLQGGICAVQLLGDAIETYGNNDSTLEDRGILYLQAMIYVSTQ